MCIFREGYRITADTALRLSKYFGNSAKFWLGLQDDYDIEEEKISKEDELNSIKHYENKNLAQQCYNPLISLFTTIQKFSYFRSAWSLLDLINIKSQQRNHSLTVGGISLDKETLLIS